VAALQKQLKEKEVEVRWGAVSTIIDVYAAAAPADVTGLQQTRKASSNGGCEARR
jgi:hypothetical protein